jgi:hypothetical protein
MAKWIVFTMDNYYGSYATKRGAVLFVLNRCLFPVAGRKLRRGAYEYRSDGGTRAHTYWVMTEAEAHKDGWEPAAEPR